MSKIGLLFVSAALAVVLACGVVWADSFRVTNTNDSGAGSLRAAIVEANAQPDRDVITFAPNVRGTILLQEALPTLDGEVEIRGPGASNLTVRRVASKVFRIFSVAPEATVTISGLTISKGLAPADFATGGGIYIDRGELLVKNCSFSENRAGGIAGTASATAGAIANSGGRVRVVGSTFSANTATFLGGAIANYLGGPIGDRVGGRLTVRGSTFSANKGGSQGGAIITSSDQSVTTVLGSTFSENAAESGGAILNYGGRTTVSASTFSRNSSTSTREGANPQGGAITNVLGELKVSTSTFSENSAGGSGGAIHSGDPFIGSARSTVVNSTFSKNTARDGGGIYNVGELLTVRNSTFSENTATDSGGGLHNDMGHDFPGTARVNASTFTDNSASNVGGGLYNSSFNDAANFSLRMTIVANNEAPQSPDASGAFTSGGYSLIGSPGGATGFGGTDLTSTGARLDPQGLQDNGGPTNTIALLADSPAVDAVGEGCPPPGTDQRGVMRPQDGDGEGAAHCDIGAYERSSSAPSLSSP